MAQIFSQSGIEEMLQTQMRESVAVALKKIADDACEKLRAEIMGQADALAISMLREYDISVNADRVIISVKKTTN